MEVLMPTILQGFITVGALLIGARIATNQYARQKWWELKVQAYSEIIKQLALLALAFEALSNLERDGVVNDGLWTRHATASHAANDFINQTAAMGSFLVSDATAAALANVRSKLAAGLQEAPTFSEFFDEATISVRDCIALVNREAKQDLRLANRWWWSK